MSPPYYDTMSRRRRRPWSRRSSARTASTRDEKLFAEIYKDDYGHRYLERGGRLHATDVIDCVRDICTYIYETHGRFPAHCDAIHVPGVWLQVHHVDDRLL